jgi:hypothetical protein
MLAYRLPELGLNHEFRSSFFVLLHAIDENSLPRLTKDVAEIFHRVGKRPNTECPPIPI